jgi:hypothetical protein
MMRTPERPAGSGVRIIGGECRLTGSGQVHASAQLGAVGIDGHDLFDCESICGLLDVKH